MLFDLDPDPAAAARPEPWLPRPEPGRSALLADALRELAGTPVALARAAAGAVTHPQDAVAAGVDGARRACRDQPRGDRRARRARRSTSGSARTAASRGSTPTSRRFKDVKNALGGTVNDVVLTVVTGALRSHLIAHGHDTAPDLKAMVPVSVRADSERGALGNRVTAIYAPLPIGLADPIARFRAIHEAMRGLKESGQAVGAEVLTALTDFAPPTILSQAARLQAVQRFFNLTVTNVPGPQFPLYLLGRRLCRVYPQVPLAENCALGHRDHVLRRADRLRPARRLRRAAGPRRARRAARRGDRRAGVRGRHGGPRRPRAAGAGRAARLTESRP